MESVRETIALKREEAALEAERIRREKLAEQKKRQKRCGRRQCSSRCAGGDAEDIVTTKKDATDEIPSRVDGARHRPVVGQAETRLHEETVRP